ncbi:MAG TPA: phosphoribosylamine--glycine ligase, partial [Candidatus Gracilibacteria bacterium]
IIGPDDPIGAGGTDAVHRAGAKCFAPTKLCAQLESSKAFTRNLLKKHNIDASPDFLVSTNAQDPQRRFFYDQLQGQIVVKADGLLGGKGVLIAGEHFSSFDAVESFALASIEKFGRVVFEEKLIGQEFSLISIVDGTTVLDTPAIQDHKRAYENDEGPNTGGMGCVSDEHHRLPFLSEYDIAHAHQITDQTMKAIKSETGQAFVGVMYGGFIKTANGVKLIEYNARFGDPEALNILPIMKTDFLEVCQKAVDGRLSDIHHLEFEPVATVVRYLCPKGYPTNAVRNVPITTHFSLPQHKAQEENQQVFYASVAEENGQMILKGSRAIGVLGIGKDLQEAYLNNQALIDKFEGPLFYRKDIGTIELIQSRVDHMNSILN